eukprot:GHVS01050906.1.p1 GENE.GHVS01050906.1~~GHVS01050906.1.p1  ORF type:complete len:150 (+),score=46.18 GHVS01050906.1:85-534(+)
MAETSGSSPRPSNPFLPTPPKVTSAVSSLLPPASSSSGPLLLSAGHPSTTPLYSPPSSSSPIPTSPPSLVRPSEDIQATTEKLISEMQVRFHSLCSVLVSRLDDLGEKVDDLETSVGQMMASLDEGEQQEEEEGEFSRRRRNEAEDEES